MRIPLSLVAILGIAACSSEPVFDAEHAPAPLFRDPVYDGAADPEVIWNHYAEEWWIFYTLRRATIASGGNWAYANPIGIAASKDGREWRHVGYSEFDGVGGKDMPDTYWAPAVVRNGDTYHMFVSFVPGHPIPWEGDRYIVHYTAERDLTKWTKVGRLPLDSKRVIDPTLIRVGDQWRMWYKDESRGSRTHFAVSDDEMRTWRTMGPAPGDINSYGHEGDYAFRWKGNYWMIMDPGVEPRIGLDVFRSDDAAEWTRVGRILVEPGHRALDDGVGRHASVAVAGDRAFIVYFVHPFGGEWPGAIVATPDQVRSVLQVAELEYRDGAIHCDRDRYWHSERE
jgi:hypothetical protein